MRGAYRETRFDDEPGAGPGALPLVGMDDEAWAVRTPMRRLVAVADEPEVIARTISRHEQRGWTYVEPDGHAPVALYFGMRMLSFRRTRSDLEA